MFSSLFIFIAGIITGIVLVIAAIVAFFACLNDETEEDNPKEP
jgi:hypothetical protein